MPELMISGPIGRLEARFSPGINRNAPVALVLHPHPLHGGTMNNRVSYALYQTFVERGFSVLRFNFRGVGRSQGTYDRGEGELADAAAALDWLESTNPDASASWIAGFSFGAWIGMQLLMRRPEVAGFISISPPANMFDFSFLAPCPVSGLMVQGTADEIVPVAAVSKLVNKLSVQRDISVKYETIEGASHFFTDHIDQLTKVVGAYVDESNAFEIKREPVRLRGQPAPMQPPSEIPKVSKKVAENKKLAVVSSAGAARSLDDDGDDFPVESRKPMVKSLSDVSRLTKSTEESKSKSPAKSNPEASVAKANEPAKKTKTDAVEPSKNTAKPKPKSAAQSGDEKAESAVKSKAKTSGEAPTEKLTFSKLRSRFFGASN